MDKDGVTTTYSGIEELYIQQAEANPIYAKSDIPTLIKAWNLPKSPSLKILDLGCGTGFCTRLLKQRTGGHVLGVDIDDVMINRAKLIETKAKSGISYCVGDGRKSLMTIPEVSTLAPFDMVNLSWVLPHLKTCAEVKAMATAMYGVLKVGGRVCGVTFNPHLDEKMMRLHERYGQINCFAPGPSPEDEGQLIQCTTVNDPKLPALVLTGYHMKDYQLASAFREAGFQDFHIVPPPHLFETENPFERDFYKPYTNKPPSAIFLGTKASPSP
jgi:SAM-dependent methyltransferase